MNVGHELVCNVISESKITSLIESGFNGTWLTANGSGSEVIFSGEDKQVYQWILDHWKRHHKVPSEQLFAENFPAYPLSRASSDNIDELIYLAMSKVQSFLVAELIGKTIDLYDTGKVDNAVALLSTESDRLHKSLKYRTYRSDNLAGEFDVESLLVRDFSMGIPMGLKIIDDEFFGFQPGYLVTFLGRQKAGKTTFMLNSALKSFEEGYTVLFFSVEMDVDMLRDRFYCLGAGVSPSRMMQGKLHDSEKSRVREFHAKLADPERPDFFISKKKSLITIDDVIEEIEYCNPSVIYIDGFNFMYDKRTKATGNDWQANENLAAELKTIALENGTTIVVAAQVQEKQHHAKFGIEARTIAGGTGLLKASDLVIGLDKEGDEHTISCVMSRYNYFNNVVADINWNSMEISHRDPMRMIEERTGA